MVASVTMHPNGLVSGSCRARSRRAPVVIVVAVAALFAAPVAHAHSQCATAGHTVVSNELSRVFSRHRLIHEFGHRVRAEFFYACVRADGRVVSLKTTWPDTPRND